MPIRNNGTFGIAGVSKETNFHSLSIYLPRSSILSSHTRNPVCHAGGVHDWLRGLVGLLCRAMRPYVLRARRKF